MFKRAIAIFAFSVFLISDTTPVTTQPLPHSPQLDSLPDFIITDLFLNPQRKLIVTITNIGNTPLPLGGGSLMMMVDGSLKGIYTLGSLTHQSILPWLPTSLAGLNKELENFQGDFQLIGKHIANATNELPRRRAAGYPTQKKLSSPLRGED